MKMKVEDRADEDDPVLRPSRIWPTALRSVVRREGEAIESFFQEADSHFSSRLKIMRESAGEGPFSDHEIDYYVDLRDELEGFELTNRYFALVQAAGVIERVSVRLVEVAIDAGLLNRSEIYGKSRFLTVPAAERALSRLAIALPPDDARSLRQLATNRNLILHSGRRLPRTTESKEAYEPIRYLEISDEDVSIAIRLTSRCANERIKQFRKVLDEANLFRD